MLDNENRVKVCVQILSAIYRPSHMIPFTGYEAPASFVGHPFDQSKNKDFITFVGMSSDDIYPLIFHALNFNTAPVTGLRFWLVPQKDNTFHHQIFAEVETEFETFMCSGMTDHSGSGSAAYETCKQMFELLSMIYEVKVETILAQVGQDDLAWAKANAAILEDAEDD